MIETIKMTADGDIDLNENGQATWITGEEAIEQIVRRTFALWKGSLYSDTERGIDWLSIASNTFNRNGIIETITKGLLQNQYIQKVIDIGLVLENNNLTVTYLVKADNQVVNGSIIL